MKAFKIISPAYYENGLNGTYYSIAICDDNGNFEKVIGDHKGENGLFFYPKYKNINKIIGLAFSDSDRFIRIEEVNIDLKALAVWEEKYNDFCQRLMEYEAHMLEFCNGDIMSFFREHREEYDAWLKLNPHPVVVNYYDFLKCVTNVE